jgi:hypothetical protein
VKHAVGLRYAPNVTDEIDSGLKLGNVMKRHEVSPSGIILQNKSIM